VLKRFLYAPNFLWAALRVSLTQTDFNSNRAVLVQGINTSVISDQWSVISWSFEHALDLLHLLQIKSIFVLKKLLVLFWSCPVPTLKLVSPELGILFAVSIYIFRCFHIHAFPYSVFPLSLVCLLQNILRFRIVHPFWIVRRVFAFSGFCTLDCHFVEQISSSCPFRPLLAYSAEGALSKLDFGETFESERKQTTALEQHLIFSIFEMTVLDLHTLHTSNTTWFLLDTGVRIVHVLSVAARVQKDYFFFCQYFSRPDILQDFDSFCTAPNSNISQTWSTIESILHTPKKLQFIVKINLWRTCNTLQISVRFTLFSYELNHSDEPARSTMLTFGTCCFYTFQDVLGGGKARHDGKARRLFQKAGKQVSISRYFLEFVKKTHVISEFSWISTHWGRGASGSRIIFEGFKSLIFRFSGFQVFWFSGSSGYRGEFQQCHVSSATFFSPGREGQNNGLSRSFRRTAVFSLLYPRI